MIRITYFVHSITTDNENGIATGWLPGELSEEGVRRAKDVAKVVQERRFDAVFCSDLRRAVDSARLFFGPARKIIQDKRLREAHYGDLDGGPHSFKSTMADYIDNPFPNGESYKDVEKRLRSFCKFLKSNYNGTHSAIVAHQGPQLALDVILRGKTWQQAIAEDWRKHKAWRPGWEYTIED